MQELEREILNVIRNLRTYAKCCVDLDSAVRKSAIWRMVEFINTIEGLQ